jgi:Lon protease-like protein
MAHRLPLFPLGSILFPGATLPLRVFEERYRRLVGDLLERPADAARHFGVVGIEFGHEVGAAAAQRLSAVGCVAEVRGVRRHGDGRYDLVIEGGTRFRVEEVYSADTDHPYLRADTTPLPDAEGPGAEARAERVARLFAVYRERLAGIGVPAGLPAEPPSEPLPLSYAVSAAMIIDQRDRQELLEADHAAARLELAARLLRRENRVLTAFPSLPAGRTAGADVNLN